MPFVSTCLCSFELGLEKPDPEIFKLALKRAGRVAQGFARFQSPRDSWDEPHLTVNSLAEATPALIGRLHVNVA
jgi:hypothetical protein